MKLLLIELYLKVLQLSNFVRIDSDALTILINLDI
jgi:hypothetical protein